MLRMPWKKTKMGEHAGCPKLEEERRRRHCDHQPVGRSGASLRDQNKRPPSAVYVLVLLVRNRLVEACWVRQAQRRELHYLDYAAAAALPDSRLRRS